MVLNGCQAAAGGELFIWLKELFSILSLNQCVFVCLNAIHGQMWASFWLRGEVGACCSTRPCERSSRDAGKCSRSSAGWKDCNQTINQKSVNCHPVTPPPPSLCTPSRPLSAESSECYVTYSHAYTTQLWKNGSANQWKMRFAHTQAFYDEKWSHIWITDQWASKSTMCFLPMLNL